MKDFSIIKKLLKLLLPYKFKLIIIVVFVIISTVVSLVTPLLIRNITDDGLLKENISVVIYMSTLLFLFVALDRISAYFQEKVRIKLQTDIIYSLNKEAFLKLAKVKLKEINMLNETELFNRISTDINSISLIADKSLFFIITQMFSIIGGCIGLFLINWKLSLIVLCFVPVKFFSARYFAKRRKSFNHAFIEKNSDFAQWFGETIAGIKEVRMFHLIEKKNSELKHKQKEIVQINKSMNLLSETNNAAESILIQLLVSVLYIVGAILLINGELTIGSISAFLSYSIRVTAPVSSILNIGYFLSGIIPSAKRHFKFLDTESEASACIKTVNVPTSSNSNRPILIFKNVFFAYDHGQEVLKNINITINNKEKIAFIGTNGSGKSSIINLLFRFYTPDKGTILLNGINIDDYNIDYYRSNFAPALQNAYLFNDTIKGNIVLNKEIDDAAFNHIIDICQLRGFYSLLPDTYKVGENGSRLSAGQKQKITIARAIAKNADILILDEATSSLDIESEILISSLIDTHLSDKTIIAISHRPELLKHMDRIILLDKGSVVKTGTHDELLLSSELYKKIIFQENTKLYTNCIDNNRHN